jgi:adenine-specific DNA-methyltransferase
VITETKFQTLPLEQQKEMFLTMLDLNQMYVQRSEMGDKRYRIKQSDQDLTKQFYRYECF